MDWAKWGRLSSARAIMPEGVMMVRLLDLNRDIADIITGLMIKECCLNYSHGDNRRILGQRRRRDVVCREITLLTANLDYAFGSSAKYTDFDDMFCKLYACDDGFHEMICVRFMERDVSTCVDAMAAFEYMDSRYGAAMCALSCAHDDWECKKKLVAMLRPGYVVPRPPPCNYVYMISSSKPGSDVLRVKIDWSSNPHAQLKLFRGSGGSFKLATNIVCGRETLDDLHMQYNSRHLGDNWFTFTQAELDQVVEDLWKGIDDQ